MQILTADLAFSSFPHPVLTLFSKINPCERRAGCTQAAVLQRGGRWAEQAAAAQLWLSEQPSMSGPRWSRLSEDAWLWMVTALPTWGGRGDDLGVLHSPSGPTWGARLSSALLKGICCCAAGVRNRGRASPIGSPSQVPRTSAQSDSPQEHRQLLLQLEMSKSNSQPWPHSTIV